MAARYGRRPAGMKKMTSAAYFGQAEVILYIFTIFTGAERNRKGLPVELALQVPAHQQPDGLVGIAGT